MDDLAAARDAARSARQRDPFLAAMADPAPFVKDKGRGLMYRQQEATMAERRVYVDPYAVYEDREGLERILPSNESQREVYERKGFTFLRYLPEMPLDPFEERPTRAEVQHLMGGGQIVEQVEIAEPARARPPAPVVIVDSRPVAGNAPPAAGGPGVLIDSSTTGRGDDTPERGPEHPIAEINRGVREQVAEVLNEATQQDQANAERDGRDDETTENLAAHQTAGTPEEPAVASDNSAKAPRPAAAPEEPGDATTSRRGSGSKDK